MLCSASEQSIAGLLQELRSGKPPFRSRPLADLQAGSPSARTWWEAEGLLLGGDRPKPTFVQRCRGGSHAPISDAQSR